MKKQFFKFIIVSILFILCSFNLIVKDKQVSDFKLKNAKTNKLVSLSDYKNAKGFIIIFTCNKCPMAKFYSQRLNQMSDKYKTVGIPLIAINSMDTLAYAEESFRKMQIKVKNDQLNFPYLQDKKQVVGKKFNATVTPQAFVIWKQNNKFVILHSETSQVMPNKTNISCWWCAHEFDNIPCYIPIKIVNDTYYVHGNFCTYNCALSYMNNEYENRHESRTLYTNIKILFDADAGVIETDKVFEPVTKEVDVVVLVVES